jgi:glutathione S-transferase
VYRLYWSPGTGALAPQAVLEEVGAPYERIVVLTDKLEHLRPEFLAINPQGRIPVLVLPDGSVMTESAAMVLHLCDCHPAAGLLPAPGTAERAQAYRWLLFLATSVYAADLRWYHADRYTSAPGGIEGVREAALAEMGRLFDLLEAELADRPWLLWSGFSAVDIYLLMLVSWHPRRPRAAEPLSESRPPRGPGERAAGAPEDLGAASSAMTPARLPA